MRHSREKDSLGGISLTWVDYLIIVILAIAAIQGMRRGFVGEVLHLAALIVAGVIAIKAYPTAGALVVTFTGIPATLANIGSLVAIFIILFGLILVLVEFLIRPVNTALHLLPPLRVLNDVGGALVSMAISGIIVSLLVALLGLFPPVAAAREAVDSSVLARGLTDTVGRALPQIENWLGQASEAIPITVDQPADESPSPKLNFPPDLTLQARPDLEDQMLNLVNMERAKQGLLPVAMDERLREVARQHSEEMFRLSYFAHQSPVSGSPSDRLRNAGIPFLAAGENLAYAPTLATAHEGLMNSPGHRANILSPEFRLVGIGIIDAGPQGKMFTQDFTN
ncbi:MAG: CvpA family protein [Chloroflexi bacterium]|nr:CvpA family protein [Chloroflexota bacterium]